LALFGYLAGNESVQTKVLDMNWNQLIRFLEPSVKMSEP